MNSYTFQHEERNENTTLYRINYFDFIIELFFRFRHLHLQSLAHVLDEVGRLLPVGLLLVCSHRLPPARRLGEHLL